MLKQAMLCMTCALLLSAADRPAKKKGIVSTLGVKTPGVQIPFEKLKPEAEIPLKGVKSHIVFTDSPFVQLAGGLVKIDAKVNKAGDPIEGLKDACGGLISAFGSLWSADCGAGTLVRFDSKTLQVVATLPIGASSMAFRGLAATADSVWMLTDDRVTLSRVDPDTNRVVAELRLPPKCSSLAAAEGSLWVTCTAENKVLRINPLTNLVTKTIEVSSGPRALAFGEAAVWVLCETDGKVSRIDPKTDKVIATVDLGVPKATGDIAVGGGSIWVALTGFPLTRIDPGSDKVVQQFTGSGGERLHFGLGSLWATSLQSAKLTRIDPKRVAATFAE